MINLSALKANIDNEIEASKKESDDVFRCGMILAETVSEALEQTLDVDMLKVVRCKDCTHYLNGKCYVSNRTNKGIYPRVNIHSCNDDDFCSYGERRTNNER